APRVLARAASKRPIPGALATRRPLSRDGHRRDRCRARGPVGRGRILRSIPADRGRCEHGHGDPRLAPAVGRCIAIRDGTPKAPPMRRSLVRLESLTYRYPGATEAALR